MHPYTCKTPYGWDQLGPRMLNLRETCTLVYWNKRIFGNVRDKFQLLIMYFATGVRYFFKVMFIFNLKSSQFLHRNVCTKPSCYAVLGSSTCIQLCWWVENLVYHLKLYFPKWHNQYFQVVMNSGELGREKRFIHLNFCYNLRPIHLCLIKITTFNLAHEIIIIIINHSYIAHNT